MYIIHLLTSLLYFPKIEVQNLRFKGFFLIVLASQKCTDKSKPNFAFQYFHYKMFIDFNERLSCSTDGTNSEVNIIYYLFSTN